jgi:acyl-CoA thioesterase I
MNWKKTVVISLILMFIVAAVVTSFAMMSPKYQNSQGPIRVACVGDSITEGSEYPYALWMLLGSNYSVGNFGKGGATVSMKGSTPYMNETVFEEAKKFQPNIVIIMLGANEALPSLNQSKEDFMKDYKTLVSEFQKLTSKPQIWLVKPPPIFNDGTGLSTRIYEQTILPSIEAVAKDMNLPLIDVYSRLINHPEYFLDGVHPFSEGAQVIASVIYKALVLI